MRQKIVVLFGIVILLCACGCREKSTEFNSATTEIVEGPKTYEIEGVAFDFDPYTDDETVCEMMEKGNYVRIDTDEYSMADAVKEEFWEDVNTKETIFIHWMNYGEIVIEITTIGEYQN